MVADPPAAGKTDTRFEGSAMETPSYRISLLARIIHDGLASGAVEVFA